MRRRGGGCGLVLALLLGMGFVAWREAYPFLARQAPVRSSVLVVEGWVTDDQLLQAAAWAEANGVERIIATGGPLERGSYLSAWNTFAEMTLARMEELGLGTRFELTAAPAEKVRRGRTRASAQALKAMLTLERGAFNLATAGPHARRSWRAFQQVFGDGVEVGSVVLAPTEYDGTDWWRSSEGVRSVLGEGIAYLYDLAAAGPAD